MAFFSAKRKRMAKPIGPQADLSPTLVYCKFKFTHVYNMSLKLNLLD